MKRHPAMGCAALAVMFLMAACGSASAPEQPYDPVVTPLTGADLENTSGLPNAAGVTPCGVFNVNGHGRKAADLRQYPNCTAPDYVVACLNDKAEWISDNISEVKLIGDQVTFISQQDGACGLFAVP